MSHGLVKVGLFLKIYKEFLGVFAIHAQLFLCKIVSECLGQSFQWPLLWLNNCRITKMLAMSKHMKLL